MKISISMLPQPEGLQQHSTGPARTNEFVHSDGQRPVDMKPRCNASLKGWNKIYCNVCQPISPKFSYFRSFKTMALLEVNNLGISFTSEGTRFKAVDGISYTLERGQTLGIVGESGSGKSVSALSIMGLIPIPPGRINSGSVLFNPDNQQAVDLLKLDESAMRSYRGNHISMIFQEPMTSLNPVYTCGRQVMETLLIHRDITKKEARAKTIDLFNEVKLPRPESIFKSYPHEISGGQKQRVMIAMAIACNPAILIADEPTTALDVTVQKSILELLKSLQQKHNMAIIFITHDLGVIAEIADEIAVMYQGKIVEHAVSNELFNHPKHPYTKGLLACRPRLDKRFEHLPTVGDFMEESSRSALNLFKEIQDEQRKKNHEKLYVQAPVLEVNNLQTWFPDKRSFFGRTKEWVKAVDDINFMVYPGETLGLVGESGCGKTTLGRTILKLIDAKDGSIKYKGQELRNLNQKQFRRFRKDLQIIFQDPYSSLNPRITIGSAITEPMNVHGIGKGRKTRREKAIELLHRVDLSENHFNRYPHELSGGQRQRVCIARALALEPEFIICDESVSALDVSVQAQVLNLLNELKREFNFTYIFISHDLSVVKFMSDRIIVMKDGKIQESAEADELYRNPQTEYTRKLIEAIPE
ncbi:MAG: ABC transporter ATP-binding protein [Bacteroidales bacterium]|nr:ABC transporter ATP-binding protein [Bacteroidales bacterium]